MVWIAVIAVIKVVNIVSGYVRKNKQILLHTKANKLTGLLLFVLPLTMEVVDINLTAIPVCAVAMFAAIQEGHYFVLLHKFSKRYGRQ